MHVSVSGLPSVRVACLDHILHSALCSTSYWSNTQIQLEVLHWLPV